MNRATRRALKVKPEYPVFDGQIVASSVLQPGSLLTIAGLRQRKNGTFDTNCQPGQETIFRLGAKG